MKRLAAFVFLALGAAPAWSAEQRPPRDDARPCPAFGPGFVRVAGSETCVRVSGRVRAEYGTARRISRDDIAGFGAGARVEMDVRSQTDYGPLRSVVRLRGGRNSSAE